MGLTVELILRKRYLIIWKIYSTQNKNPFQILITWKVYSVQLNANLTKELYNLQDFPKPNLLRESKLATNVFDSTLGNEFPFLVRQVAVLSQTLEPQNILGLQLPTFVTQTTRISTCTCQTVTKIERSRRGSRNTEIPNIKVHCRISS